MDFEKIIPNIKQKYNILYRDLYRFYIGYREVNYFNIWPIKKCGKIIIEYSFINKEVVFHNYKLQIKGIWCNFVIK